MATLYKLTDENGRTRNATQWGQGVTHFVEGPADQPLCSDGWIHAYEHPLLAVLLNPIHGNFENPRLWEAKGVVGKRDGQLKCGCRALTTLREIPLPTVTLAQRRHFAILCVKQVCDEEAWNRWADAWLNGSDRTKKTAAKAARAAAKAARAAAFAAWAAEAAAEAEAAAKAARVAAAVAVVVAKELDLIALAEQAIKEERQ